MSAKRWRARLRLPQDSYFTFSSSRLKINVEQTPVFGGDMELLFCSDLQQTTQLCGTYLTITLGKQSSKRDSICRDGHNCTLGNDPWSSHFIRIPDTTFASFCSFYKSTVRSWLGRGWFWMHASRPNKSECHAWIVHDMIWYIPGRDPVINAKAFQASHKDMYRSLCLPNTCLDCNHAVVSSHVIW